MSEATPGLSITDRIRQGDKKALAELYDAYSGMVYGVVLKIVSNRELVEEIVQDVFLRVWKNMENFDPTKARISTWIINIARNRAIDELRSKSFRNQSENQTLENSVNEVDRAESTNQKVDTIGIKNLTRHLRPEQQQLIELVYFGGYTHEEAAEHLSIPLGTVKTRIRNSILELRKIVKIES
ncbi:MAG: sigma-70 family RNA polymerase sigma factor [Bacteroidetes bacterium]|nr:MAG: sigma-70 family RNA polymerase sigma factor [Bacteroidota bacterium]